MSNYERFKKISTDYDNQLYAIFIEVIDTAISYATEKKMDPLDKFLYVDNEIEQAYRELACAMGIIVSPDTPYEVTPPISDDLMERIYSYTDPLVNEAREVLQREVDKIIDSSTLGELMEKYDTFKKMLDDKCIKPFMYEDIEIKKRV